MTIEINEMGLRTGVEPSPMPMGPPSIAALVEQFPLSDEPALIDRNGVVTYRELVARVRGAIRRLRSLGVGPGTVIAASAANRAELVVAFLAVQRIGALWVGINPALAPPEKLVQIKDCEPVHILVDERVAAELRSPQGGGFDFPKLLALDEEALAAARVAESDQADEPLPMPDPMAPAALGYTSGTTGAPKGVVHCQHSMMTFTNGSLSWQRGQWLTGARRGISITLTILNLMVYGPLLALTAKGCCALIDRGDAAGVGRWIQDHRIEIFNGAPTTLSDLLYKPELQDLDLSSLKAVALGGGPVPAPLFDAFRARFGYELVADYGLSESPAGVITSGAADGDPPGQFFRPHPQLALAILDENGKALPQGASGELCVGPHAEGPWAGVYTGMLGYWRRPDTTRGAFHGRWLRTGDQASFDETGRLVIAGRQNEMILRGGANVFPTEIENLLRRHEVVADVVVLGLPDDRLGQMVAAFIIPKPDASQEQLAQRLREHCQGEIARYKIPQRWFLVDEFPRNALAKPIRREVQALTHNELV